VFVKNKAKVSLPSCVERGSVYFRKLFIELYACLLARSLTVKADINCYGQIGSSSNMTIIFPVDSSANWSYPRMERAKSCTSLSI